jgi:hypothetical protein
VANRFVIEGTNMNVADLNYLRVMLYRVFCIHDNNIPEATQTMCVLSR